MYCLPCPKAGWLLLIWTVCMQLVYGLEHLVEVTVAKKVPAAAAATTLIARLANNVIGGENFIDMARWTGIQ